MSEPTKEGGLPPCPFCGPMESDQPIREDRSVFCQNCGVQTGREKEWVNAYCWKELAAKDATIRALGEALEEYGQHDNLGCFRNLWQGGEPTASGEYRTMYNGVWYQSKPIDETPKCNCGFAEALALIKGEGKSIPESEENKKEKHHGGTGSITI